MATNLKVGSYAGLTTDINVVKLPAGLCDAFKSLTRPGDKDDETSQVENPSQTTPGSGNLHGDTASALMNLLQQI